MLPAQSTEPPGATNDGVVEAERQPRGVQQLGELLSILGWLVLSALIIFLFNEGG